MKTEFSCKFSLYLNSVSINMGNENFYADGGYDVTICSALKTFFSSQLFWRTSDTFAYTPLPPHPAFFRPSEGRSRSYHRHRRMQQRQAACQSKHLRWSRSVPVQTAPPASREMKVFVGVAECLHSFFPIHIILL